MIWGGKTPQEFLERLEDDWRKEMLLEIREMLLSYEDLQETMTYGMLTYGDGTETEPFLALNAQKNYVAVYVGNISKIDPDKSLLQGLSMGKGCIRFSKTKKVVETGLEEFIQRAVEIWRAGGDTSC